MRSHPLTRAAVALVASFATSSFHVTEPQGRGAAPTPAQSPPMAKRRTIQTETDEDLIARFFSDCDANGNGTINFKEAEASLSLDRAGFAVFDKDKDGLIDATEFKDRYETVKRLGGAFPTPLTKEGALRGPPRSPEALFRVYDLNGDGALDALELKRALDQNSVDALPADVALETLDQDGSGKLEARELTRLAAVLFRRGPDTRTSAPKSIEELFGKAKRREKADGATPQAPLIPGPVSAFRRLDFDNDGRIDAQDLLELLRPLQAPVRVNALIAAIDTDGDGALSEAEFKASMAPKTR